MGDGNQNAKKGAGEQVAEKLMKDDRFGRLFTDKEFQIDRASEAFKLIKPQGGKKGARDDDVDSVQQDEVPQARDMNKLFEGRAGEESDGSAEGDSNDF